jgi:Tol biopolymer transport system component
MNEPSLDARISAWLIDEAPDQLPDRVLRATLDRTRGSRQHRALLRVGRVPRVLRQRWLLVAVGLLALLAATLLVVGSRRAPAPLTIGRNGVIAYDKDWHIFIQAADGSGRTQLTDRTNDFWPEWSPDGSKLAFYRSPDTTDAFRDLSVWVMNADGSGAVNVTRDMSLSIEYGWQLAWSPASNELAFAATSDLTSVVYVARADGTEVHQIVDPSHVASAPAWSPDGKTVAVRAGLYDDERGIYVAGSDGSGLRKLTTQIHQFNGYSPPVWSPDGTKLMFHAGSSAAEDVWVIGSDGTNEHQLVDTPFPLAEIGPEWSPDGSRIAFLRLDNAASSGTVFVMNADGSQPHPVSPPTADGPVWWSPDGTRVMARLCPTSDCGSEDIWNIVALDPARVAEPQVLNSDRGIGLLSWQRLPP